VALDGRGTLYALDDKYFRILEIDREGKVVRQLRSRPMDRAHFQYWSELAVDEDVLYASKVVYFVDTEIVDYEEIDRYPPGGGEEVLYLLKHEGDTEVYDTRLLTLQPRGGYLYFDVRGPRSVELRRVPLRGGTDEHVLTIPAPNTDVYNLAGTEPGSLYITSYSGDRIFKLEADGKLSDAALHPANPGVPGIVLADKVFFDRDGSLLVTDLFNQCVYRADREGGLTIRLSKSNLPGKPERALFKDIWAAADGNIAVVESIGGGTGRLVVFRPDGTAERELNAAVPTLGLWAEMLAPWGLLTASVLAFIAALVYVYLAVLNRRVALLLKLILALVPIVVISIGVISNIIFTKTFAKVEEEMKFRLATIAQAGQHMLDGEAIDRIRLPSDYLGEDYTKVAGQLDALVNGGKDSWNKRLFANVCKLYNGMFYIMDDNASSYGVLYPLPGAPFQRYRAALETGGLQTYEYTDADGTYLEAAVPITNAKGSAVAVLYVGSSKDDLQLLQQTFRAEVTRDTIIATAVFVVVIIAVSLFLLLSVNRLRGAVGRMARGEWDAEVRIRSRDEIGELGQGFNTMSRHIRGYISEITTMSDSYARFVPREFLRFLKKEKIAEIELGNQVELDMSVLFADIRSFTTISEAMKPQENFNFLNSFLGRMGPVIRRNGGFIDKYIGDGIMALFPGKAADAVRAAVEMQRELETYNRHRRRSGYQPITVGIGLHAGRVILGILGERERMEGTVISDAVNLASRLEDLTKLYGATIIVSERIIAAMNDEVTDHRYLGHATVKGKSGGVPIHEVFAADPDRDARLKRHTKDHFQRGVRRYLNRDLEGALRFFNAVLKVHPADKAAEYYVTVCARASAGRAAG
jgi:class 3 adenylate cyclase/HAMP domain-containing protein